MTRTVIVTGAGSGIGAAVARELAQRGWQVVVTDIDNESARRVCEHLATSQEQAHEHAKVDVTDPDQVTALADDVASRLGLDAWVSNAGVSAMHRFLDLPLETYDRTLDINLKGAFLCGQAAARALVRTGRRGVIVNIASMAGKQGRVPFLADYVASKFGVVGLTQAMAYELAEHGIRVNSVCPGFVATPMQDRELAWEAAQRGASVETVRQSWIDDTPLGRLEEPDDVATVVAFLVSDDAAFVTGESVAVNGGAYMD